MTNLVPLFLDKDTGQLVAGGETINGGGPALTTSGYLHVQNVASDFWVIPHFAGTTLLLVQVFDTAGNLFVPDNVEIVDINTVEVTLGTPIAGRAHIVFFESSVSAPTTPSSPAPAGSPPAGSPPAGSPPAGSPPALPS